VTPIAPAFGGTARFTAGTSSGSANAQIVTPTVPATFGLTIGNQVSFTAGFSNSGPTTAAVGITAATNVFRRTQLGISPLVGGELVAGQRVTIEYDGTQYQLISGGPYYVGSVYSWAGTTCPAGSFNANNQTVLRSSDLGTVMGTTFGVGNGSTTANVPDLRGRATYGQDQGGSGRITVAGGNFDGTVLGNSGGLQNSTALIAHSHGTTESPHSHTTAGIVGSSGGANVSTAIGTPWLSGATLTSSAVSTGLAVNSAGSGSSYSILAPALVVTKCVQG
jgi:microcystin-dependent protein